MNRDKPEVFIDNMKWLKKVSLWCAMLPGGSSGTPPKFYYVQGRKLLEAAVHIFTQ